MFGKKRKKTHRHCLTVAAQANQKSNYGYCQWTDKLVIQTTHTHKKKDLFQPIRLSPGLPPASPHPLGLRRCDWGPWCCGHTTAIRTAGRHGISRGNRAKEPGDQRRQVSGTFEPPASHPTLHGVSAKLLARRTKSRSASLICRGHGGHSSLE